MVNFLVWACTTLRGGQLQLLSTEKEYNTTHKPTYLQGLSDGVDNVFGFRKLELPGRSLLDPGPDVDLLAVIANNGDLESPTARFLWIDLLFQILDAEARGGGKGRDNTLRFPLEHLSGLTVLDTNLGNQMVRRWSRGRCRGSSSVLGFIRFAQTLEWLVLAVLD